MEVYEKSNELVDIGFCNGDGASSFYQFLLSDLAEQLNVSREGAAYYFL
jgi:hypothetical protein